MASPNDSSSTSGSSPNSSGGGVQFCTFCSKPFTRDSAYTRHLSYCRRTQGRPRQRARSCRACARAKAKCSFHALGCTRCAAKGFECVYDQRPSASSSLSASQKAKTAAATTTTTTTTPAYGRTDFTGGFIAAEGEGAFPQQYQTQMQTPPPSMDCGSNEDDFTVPGLFDFGDVSGAAMLDLVGLVGFEHVVPPTYPSSVGSISSSVGSGSDFSIDTEAAGSRVADFAGMQQQQQQISLLGSSETDLDDASSISIDLSLTTTGTGAKYLERLPMSHPVAQYGATLVLQALRAFPERMLRRQAFPPFVHPHWHLGEGGRVGLLPEPLSVCVSISHIFQQHTPDTRPFMWRTITAEQRRVVEHPQQFSKQDLLAAIQSHIVYIVMGVSDDAKQPKDWKHQMLLSFQLLCKQFRILCNGPFSEDEQCHPSVTWEDWIFAESRRRTACVWFLISRVVSVKTGVRCDTTEAFRALPLPSCKAVWEACSRGAWQEEMTVAAAAAVSSCSGSGLLRTFGDLLELHKGGGDTARRLDSWNAGVDGLGALLNVAVAML